MFSLLLALCTFGTVGCSLSLPPTTGPYGVGSKAWVLNKITENDPVTPGGTGRSLIINVYYPTRDQVVPRPYIWDGLAKYYEDWFNLTAGAFGNATARIQDDAEPIPKCDDTSLPTLLWSPPFSGPPSQMWAGLFTELVSNGYTIVTVDHPSEQPYLQYPNGTGVTGLGKDFIPPDEGFIGRVHEYRLDEMRALLDALPNLQKEVDVPLNLTHVAFFGHSLGGSAAVNSLLYNKNRTHPEMTGAIDIDGQVFPPAFANDSSADVHRPTLLLMSDEHFAVGDFSLAQFVTWQTSWSKFLIIHGDTKHLDFSDLLVLLQGNGVTEGTGGLKAGRMVQITRSLVGAFFDLVSGRAGEGILSGSEDVKEEWPEIEFASSAPSEDDRE